MPDEKLTQLSIVTTLQTNSLFYNVQDVSTVPISLAVTFTTVKDSILTNTGVAAATYGDSSHVGQFTVDAKGRITAASDIAIAGSSLTVEEEDGVPTVNNVNTIKVSNGTLTDHGGGVVSIVNNVSTACPSPLTNGDPTTPALVFSPAGDVIMVGC